jgi:hypothetical protein
MRDVQPDVVLQYVSHQAMDTDTASNRVQQHQDVGAFIAFGHGALNSLDLTPRRLIRGGNFCFSLEISDILSIMNIRVRGFSC